LLFGPFFYSDFGWGDRGRDGDYLTEREPKPEREGISRGGRLVGQFTELGEFVVVIFSIKDFPLPASLFNGFLLRLNFVDGLFVEGFVEFDLLFNRFDDDEPDFVEIVQKFDLIILLEESQYLT
jgi:hypothetical protein